MTSSNRHWPSMFKSKPCNNHHHQWQHDINASSLITAPCHRSSFSSACEERNPEPKPRWNPKPEQIRILEAIFNSGMVNPPRDEIRKIRAQLQQYGQVGDANVFYWFQNRKSRSKHKLKLQNAKQSQTSSTARSSNPNHNGGSSSSSTKKSSSSHGASANSASVDQKAHSFPVGHNEWLSEPGFLFPVQPLADIGFGDNSQLGFGLSDNNEFYSLVQVNEQVRQQQYEQESSVSGGLVVPGSRNYGNFFVGEVINGGNEVDDSKFVKEHVSAKMKVFGLPDMAGSSSPYSNTLAPAPPTVSCPAANAATVPLTITQAHQVAREEGGCPARTMVLINDVAVEVASGPFNVREAFGEHAVLINSSGQPVLTNEWGVTLQPLQNGAVYYLI